MNAKSFLVPSALLIFLATLPLFAAAGSPSWIDDSVAALEQELVEKYGESQRDRLQRGLGQGASFWRAEDGDSDAFEAFVRRNFAGDEETLDVMFERFQKLLEQLDGHMLEILLAFREQSDLDLGPSLPFY